MIIEYRRECLSNVERLKCLVFVTVPYIFPSLWKTVKEEGEKQRHTTTTTCLTQGGNMKIDGVVCLLSKPLAMPQKFVMIEYSRIEENNLKLFKLKAFRIKNMWYKIYVEVCLSFKLTTH